MIIKFKLFEEKLGYVLNLIARQDDEENKEYLKMCKLLNATMDLAYENNAITYYNMNTLWFPEDALDILSQIDNKKAINLYDKIENLISSNKFFSSDKFFKNLVKDHNFSDLDMRDKYDKAIELTNTHEFDKLVKFANVNVDVLTNALTKSIMYGKCDMVEKLIKVGSNVNYINSEGNTLLIIACKFVIECAVKELIDVHLDLNIQNRKGDTALITAAKIATPIIDEDGNEVKDDDDHIDYHRKYANECIYLLIEAGADWNIENDEHKDFLNYLSEEDKNIILKKYKVQSQDYLVKIDTKKYNL